MKLQNQEITDKTLQLKALEIKQKMIEKWDGKYPTTIMGDGTSALFNMNNQRCGNMTEKQLYDLIGFTNLDMANGIESFNDCFYYYFEFGDTGFYILTDEWNDKIGIFYIMSDDIQIGRAHV